jgi:putative thioredoxin
MTDNPHIFTVTFETFPSLVIDKSQEIPVVVDFWAAWCSPCQMLMPVLAKLVQEYQGKFVLAKVNTDQERELAAHYGVRSLPTVKIFRHGKVVDEFMGAQSETVVRSYLDRYIERESDRLRQLAVAAQNRGDLDIALKHLRRAAELESDNGTIQVDLARLLIERGEVEEARRVLRTLPDEVQRQAQVRSLQAFLDLASVAQGLERATLEAVLAADPSDNETRYRLATVQVLARDYARAMANLLEIVRRDRKFRDDGARKAMLTVFDLLGSNNDLVNRYRKQLINLLH